MTHQEATGHELNDVHVDLFKRLDKGVLKHSQGKDLDGGLSHDVGALQVKEFRQYLYLEIISRVLLTFICVSGSDGG